MEVKVYTQIRECWLKYCLGEDCPVSNMGCLGEEVNFSFNPMDQTSYTIFHYEGNTIVVKYSREKVEQGAKEITPAGDLPFSTLKKGKFLYYSCITQVRVCGLGGGEVLGKIMESAREESVLTPKKAENIMKSKIEKNYEMSTELVKKHPHLHRNPERKLEELEKEFRADLIEAEIIGKQEEVCRIAEEEVE